MGAPRAGTCCCTFVVEEAAIHQHEPALVPLLHPRAGLRESGGESSAHPARGCPGPGGTRHGGSSGTCLYSHPLLVTAALGFLFMELERFPKAMPLREVRAACRWGEEPFSPWGVPAPRPCCHLPCHTAPDTHPASGTLRGHLRHHGVVGGLAGDGHRSLAAHFA